ncbi:prepilin-type N-terminal cleavage/methylation domain-containing protein [Colwellia sp. D2M02]|uniref:type IV pilus modification PilV family protein n=1 Tax=Colwellia sp. D2M02 TaxID=2841562 RepID=UPI001C08A703|nr:prepilin-type N-terminal cleavage/methylation domain-containing protein [Colwellia sp. D2M02]MBU2892691.1 prepilin-type N-terminal cleavage/methylation domain-containing protein [Colwellia sp. D2M02]
MKNQISNKRLNSVAFSKTARSIQGFSMVEVLIALVLSTIALLGLAAAQLKSLQYATNSFNYTVSLIQANNAIERTWANLCALQTAGAIDAAHEANIQPQTPYYTLTIPPAQLAAFANNLNITVSWIDTRLDDEAEANVDQNQAVVNAQFYQICP